MPQRRSEGDKYSTSVFPLKLLLILYFPLAISTKSQRKRKTVVAVLRHHRISWRQVKKGEYGREMEDTSTAPECLLDTKYFLI